MSYAEANRRKPEPAFNSGPTPLRGTQSFVAVLTAVWKHPSLTVLELLWRWLAAAPLLWLAWKALAPAVAQVPVDSTALASMTFFEPVRSVGVLAQQARLYLPAFRHVAFWWLPLTFLVWNTASALGRTLVLRRAEPTLRPRWWIVLAFRSVRALLFLGLLLFWALALLAAVHFSITRPGATGAEPNLVLFTAEAVAITLAAFLLWSATVWALDSPPLLALTGLRLGASERAQLRSKLIETNFVMGIVRVALFVLAMTFSASPLPFQSQETQAYINVWWVGVAVFYFCASDFFHVVRRVTSLRLLESIARGNNATVTTAS